jgi:23S rRNA (guanosine2251-2'-O)-methyltransferase
VPSRREALERLVLHATRLRIPIEEVEGGTLTALSGFDGHQGVALAVTARRFSSPVEMLARALERSEPPFILALDSLEDPQNFGTLLRTAEAAGAHGVIFPTRHQAPLSPAAVKASAGAVEHLLLAPVNDLAEALVDLHARGVRIVGAEAEAPLSAREADLRGPIAIVVGSEGRGLGPVVRRRVDLFVRIPMRGAVGSLNAAVAGSILLYEVLSQRSPAGADPSVAADGRPTVPPTDVAPVGEGEAEAAIVRPKRPRARSSTRQPRRTGAAGAPSDGATKDAEGEVQADESWTPAPSGDEPSPPVRSAKTRSRRA